MGLSEPSRRPGGLGRHWQSHLAHLALGKHGSSAADTATTSDRQSRLLQLAAHVYRLLRCPPSALCPPWALAQLGDGKVAAPMNLQRDQACRMSAHSLERKGQLARESGLAAGSSKLPALSRSPWVSPQPARRLRSYPGSPAAAARGPSLNPCSSQAAPGPGACSDRRLGPARTPGGSPISVPWQRRHWRQRPRWQRR